MHLNPVSNHHPPPRTSFHHPGRVSKAPDENPPPGRVSLGSGVSTRAGGVEFVRCAIVPCESRCGGVRGGGTWSKVQSNGLQGGGGV